MKRHFHTTTALIMLLAILSGLNSQAQQATLDDALFDALEQVITLNDQQKYLEAYRAAISTDQELERAMQGIDVSQLDDNDFELLYWPIKKSRAEVAYKLGLHNEMAKISAQLDSALGKHPNIEQARRDGMRADILKIDGGRYFLTQNYDDAVKALQEALVLKPYDSQFTTAVHDDLAQNYYAQGQYAQALAQLDTLLSSLRFSDDYRAPATKEERMEIESQRALCLARMGQFQEAQDIITPIVKHYKSRDQRRYAEALRKQGKIMMLQYDATGQYNAQAQQCYHEYLNVMQSYIDSHFLDMDENEREQFWMAEQPFVTDCYRLEDKDAELLYDVALFSKAVLLQMGREFTPNMTRADRQRILSSMRVKWRDVQHALPQDGVAIEFVTYQKGGERDHMAALIVTKGATKPVFIPIAPVDSILEYQLSVRRTVGTVINENRDDSGFDALYNDTILGELIWNEQLQQILAPHKHIYFSADGIFHQLAIEYLKPEPLKEVNLHRVTSTRLLTEENKSLRTEDMLMCGYANFDRCVDSHSTMSNDAVAYGILADQSIHWKPLLGSLNEITAVRELRGNRPSDMVIMGDSVSEPIVRDLLQRYHIALIATHGHFTASPQIKRDLVPSFSDTQLSQSCLILAGVNTNTEQPQFDRAQPDGILSAREIAGMHLDHIDLAVLSACLSGRGQVSTDGVYGLQRGLKSAGVKALVVSLWEVDDAASEMMMTSLFGNLEQGMELHEAFEQARRSLKEYSTKRGRFIRRPYADPHCYDAFILIDGI